MSGPLKRDPRLVALSHDHHQVLARCREVTLALDGVQPRDPAELAAEMVAFSNGELDSHFEAEEQILVPPYLAHAGRNRLVETLEAQHAHIRELGARLAGAGEDAVADCLSAWAEAVKAHIRFEERELFGAVQEALSEEELEAVGRGLAARGSGPACAL